ncbi:hypothetical protein [Streptomyces sp. NPDC091040]|uniref:hypothetical protein n=1 Tax=Streptomyces sp. NPDC091040 TaxID=3365972 RepID=UPI0038226D93
MSSADVEIDGVKTELLASWSKDGDAVLLSAMVDSDQAARTVGISSGDQAAHEDIQPATEGQIPMPVQLEVRVPVTDPYGPVRLSVMVGGEHWKKGAEVPRRTIEFSPDRTAVDADTGKRLKQHYSHL